MPILPADHLNASGAPTIPHATVLAQRADGVNRQFPVPPLDHLTNSPDVFVGVIVDSKATNAFRLLQAEDTGSQSGWSVELFRAPPENAIVTTYLQLPLAQQSVFPPHKQIRADALNSELALIHNLIHQQQRQINQSLQFALGDPHTGTGTLPDPIVRANSVLSFNEKGHATTQPLSTLHRITQPIPANPLRSLIVNEPHTPFVSLPENTYTTRLLTVVQQTDFPPSTTEQLDALLLASGTYRVDWWANVFNATAHLSRVAVYPQPQPSVYGTNTRFYLGNYTATHQADPKVCLTSAGQAMVTLEEPSYLKLQSRASGKTPTGSRPDVTPQDQTWTDIVGAFVMLEER